MAKNDLFTIILTNYNQEKYIYQALNSILIQKYEFIELIICDDHSRIFCKEDLLKYVNKNNKGNIISVDFIINDYNIGTVKTLNKCLKQAKGKYVLIFAADDVLYSQNVINDFYLQFKNNPNINCVSSVCALYNENMDEVKNLFPTKETLNIFNSLSAAEQNLILKKGPVFAPGCTAYQKKLFEENNYLDSEYYLIEDWSWFLRITRLGHKVLLSNTITLKHRGGGISENVKPSPFIIKKMLNDTFLIYKKEIFKSFRKLNINDKKEILDRYKIFINYYHQKNYLFLITYLFMYIKDFRLIFKFQRKKIFSILLLFISLLMGCTLYKYIFKSSIIYLCFIIPAIYIVLYLFAMKISRR